MIFLFISNAVLSVKGKNSATEPERQERYSIEQTYSEGADLEETHQSAFIEQARQFIEEEDYTLGLANINSSILPTLCPYSFEEFFNQSLGKGKTIRDFLFDSQTFNNSFQVFDKNISNMVNIDKANKEEMTYLFSPTDSAWEGPLTVKMYDNKNIVNFAKEVSFLKKFNTGFSSESGVMGFYGCLFDESGLFIFSEKKRVLFPLSHPDIYSRTLALTPEERRSLMLKIIDSVELTHKKNIFHGCLSPDDIYVTYDLRFVRLANFKYAFNNSRLNRYKFSPCSLFDLGGLYFLKGPQKVDLIGLTRVLMYIDKRLHNQSIKRLDRNYPMGVNRNNFLDNAPFARLIYKIREGDFNVYFKSMIKNACQIVTTTEVLSPEIKQKDSSGFFSMICCTDRPQFTRSSRLQQKQEFDCSSLLRTFTYVFEDSAGVSRINTVTGFKNSLSICPEQDFRDYDEGLLPTAPPLVLFDKNNKNPFGRTIGGGLIDMQQTPSRKRTMRKEIMDMPQSSSSKRTLGEGLIDMPQSSSRRKTKLPDFTNPHPQRETVSEQKNLSDKGFYPMKNMKYLI